MSFMKIAHIPISLLLWIFGSHQISTNCCNFSIKLYLMNKSITSTLQNFDICTFYLVSNGWNTGNIILILTWVSDRFRQSTAAICIFQSPVELWKAPWLFAFFHKLWFWNPIFKFIFVDKSGIPAIIFYFAKEAQWTNITNDMTIHLSRERLHQQLPHKIIIGARQQTSRRDNIRGKDKKTKMTQKNQLS